MDIELKGHLSYFLQFNSSSIFNSIENLTKYKHIEIKFLVVKERFQSEQPSIKQIRTNYMVVDPLSKELLPKRFHEHTARMGIMTLIDIQF